MPKNKPLRKDIIRDPVNPKDFQYLNLVYCCEQCVHFMPGEEYCAANIRVEPHCKATQDHYYQLSGKVAFCRFLEID